MELDRAKAATRILAALIEGQTKRFLGEAFAEAAGELVSELTGEQLQARFGD